MCRLLGICSKKETDLNYYFFDADERPFISFSNEHHDGWGIGWYAEGKPHIYKEGLDEQQSYSFDKVRTVQSSLIIAHLRKASTHISGNKISLNTHPFVYDQWLFAHNGSLNHQSLKTHIEENYEKSIKGDTDSEIFFLLLLQFYKKTKNISQSLEETLQLIKQDKYKGLNFLLSDGSILYAYRNASLVVKDQFDYHSLNYLVKEDHVVISSNPLTRERWTLLKMGELLTIDKNLKIETKIIL